MSRGKEAKRKKGWGDKNVSISLARASSDGMLSASNAEAPDSRKGSSSDSVPSGLGSLSILS